MPEQSLLERADACDIPEFYEEQDGIRGIDSCALDGQWSYAYESGAESGMVSVRGLAASFGVYGEGHECPISSRDGHFVMYEGTKTEAIVTAVNGSRVVWKYGGTRIVWTRQSLLHVTVRRVSGAVVLESQAIPSGTPIAELDARVRKVIGAEGQGNVLMLISGGRVLTAKDLLDSSMCALTAVFSPERFKTVDVDSRTQFEVPETLTVLKKRVWKSALGTVAAFEDRLNGKKLSVKKVSHLFDDVTDASRVISEVRLLRRLRHENIVEIVDVFPPVSPDFDTVYIATAFMDSDLHRVCQTKSQNLTEEHHQYFIYQILRGVLYVHSAGIVHRSIRPTSLLVSRNCHLKISDFMDVCVENAEPVLAEFQLSSSYPLNRWHSAPEHILGRQASTAQDIWSVGAVLGELLGRKVLFPGRDSLDQIKKHLMMLGTPSKADLDWLPVGHTSRKFIARLPTSVRRAWPEVFPNASEATHTLLGALLSFNPLRRVTASEALAFPFLEEHHMPEDEPVAEAKLELETLEPSPSSLRACLYSECAELRPHIRDRNSERIRELGVPES